MKIVLQADKPGSHVHTVRIHHLLPFNSLLSKYRTYSLAYKHQIKEVNPVKSP